jgi:carbon storage regulator
VVGGDVVVTVLEIKGGQVRLGVDAPRDVSIHRSEVHEQVLADETLPPDD